MNFLIGALPTLFSSPLVRNVAGSLGKGLLNIAKKTATQALNNFVGETARSTRSVLEKRVNPYLERMSYYDYNEADVDPNDDKWDAYPRRQRYIPNSRNIVSRKRIKRN